MSIYKYGLLCILTFSLILNISASDAESAAEDRKIKLASCVKLLNIRITEDKDFIEEAVKAFVPKFRETSFDVVFETIKKNLLVGCFSEISLIKAADINNLPVLKVNPFTKENKALLNFDRFNEKFNEDKEKFDKTLKLVNHTGLLLIAEIGKLEENIATTIDPLISRKNKKNSEHISKSTNKEQYEEPREERQNQQQAGSEYLDESEYSNLNLNIFGYNLNSPFIRNTFGFSLLGLVILGLYLSYKAVTKEEPKPTKKKNKKRYTEDKDE